MRTHTQLEQPVVVNTNHHPVISTLEQHPATQLFDITIQRMAEHSIELDVALKDPQLSHNPALSSLLGSIIDCGVRTIPTEHSGGYDISEYELSFISPWRGEPLQLRGSIEMEQEHLAVFICELVLPNGHCVAQAQGTLLTAF